MLDCAFMHGFGYVQFHFISIYSGRVCRAEKRLIFERRCENSRNHRDNSVLTCAEVASRSITNMRIDNATNNLSG